ncbi:TrmH family RNA methyltransferase [Myceligenerans pegani]|uniref:RNA methyltransferase n=1 Tax=Myceligenerans pegani TaxID=2776917 RepID=A0ABR9MSR5_9MICO|nr:TrmH family RNA methyltransferase [Myceligenerans sp. TRM 65318]MBE1874428.1 RNA methyltransferase [Myceligenerans sp. TRM 65318]MBE3016699.1 RNA methyltransferase [Myceligenerans sp. TRM 65318]
MVADGSGTPGPAPAVGVGPWPGGPEAWPTVDDGAGPRPDPRYDPELLAEGDRRNVADRYRYWTVEAIVADMDARRPADRQLHVAIENWSHDLNIGSVVRTANAFNVAGVHVVGRRRWNRRGAMVTDRYLHVHHHPHAAELAAWAAGQEVGESGPARPGRGERAVGEDGSAGPSGTERTVGEEPGDDGRALPIIGIDNIPGSVPIEGHDLPPRCILLFGQESTGLTPEAQAVCDVVLHITQYGSTRSVNAGAAAAIAMHAWVAQHL